MRRTTLMLVVLVLAAAACGGGGDPAASTTVAEPATTAPPVPTTAAPAPSTTTSATSAPSTTVAAEPLALGVYLYLDEPGQPHRPGPFLAPVHREVPPTVETAAAALEALLAGPTDDEAASAPALSTQIPEGTELLDVTIADGVATVDLSAEFAADDDSAAAAMRVAQVVFTVTRYDDVTSVLFEQEGAPVAVQTSQGDLVDRPVTRDDYVDFQAIVSIETPTYDGPAGNPLRVTGQAAAFEATFEYALTDNEGLIIAEGFAMSDNGVGWGAFDFTIAYDIDTPQLGHLIVWVSSAEDGSRVNIREYPVHLVP
jgi:spore germination protein GerM